MKQRRHEGLKGYSAVQFHVLVKSKLACCVAVSTLVDYFRSDQTNKKKWLRLRLFVLCCVGLQARGRWSVPGAFSGEGRMWGPLLWSQPQAASRTAGWHVVPSALCGLEGSQPGHCCPASVHQHQEAGHHPERLWAQTGKEYGICIQHKVLVFNLNSWRIQSLYNRLNRWYLSCEPAGGFSYMHAETGPPLVHPHII